MMRFKSLALCTLVFALVAFNPANAGQKNYVDPEKYAAYVIDHKTGKVLYARNADSRRYPASLTKMMTLFLVFERLEAGDISLSTRLKVSKKAAGQQPSKIGMKVGSTISVKEAIYALVTKSANDVAMTVAENLAGSEDKFARRMTQKARALGMKNTQFRNPSGLHDPQQYTTARDMALLGRALQDRFPKKFEYFNARSYKVQRRTYRNHNRLLGRVRGVDGIKTGFIRASGFNLVSSVNTGGRSIVAVVMGGKTGRSRDELMTLLIGRHLASASNGRRTAALVGVEAPATQMAVALPKPNPKAANEYSVQAQPVRVPVPKKSIRSLDVLSGYAPFDANTGRDGDRGLDALLKSLEAAEQKSSHYNIDDFLVIRPSFESLPEPRPNHQAAAPAQQTHTQRRWAIQISSVPQESEARARLEAIQRLGVLNGAELFSYTEQFKDGHTSYYRARIGGFSTIEAALDACQSLIRRNIDCFTIRM